MAGGCNRSHSLVRPTMSCECDLLSTTVDNMYLRVKSMEKELGSGKYFVTS